MSACVPSGESASKLEPLPPGAAAGDAAAAGAARVEERGARGDVERAQLGRAGDVHADGDARAVARQDVAADAGRARLLAAV